MLTKFPADSNKKNENSSTVNGKIKKTKEKKKHFKQEASDGGGRLGTCADGSVCCGHTASGSGSGALGWRCQGNNQNPVEK